MSNIYLAHIMCQEVCLDYRRKKNKDIASDFKVASVILGWQKSQDNCKIFCHQDYPNWEKLMLFFFFFTSFLSLTPFPVSLDVFLLFLYFSIFLISFFLCFPLEIISLILIPSHSLIGVPA